MATAYRARSVDIQAQTRQQDASGRSLISSHDLGAELKVWAHFICQMVETNALRVAAAKGEGVRSETSAGGGGGRNSTRVTIFRLVPERGILRRVASCGGLASQYVSPVKLEGSSLAGRALTQREAICVSAAHSSTHLPTTDAPPRAEYAVPLTMENRIIGLLDVETAASDQIEPTTRRFMDQSARNIATALERRTRLERLRDSEARFHSIFERGNVCIGLINPKGMILSVNPALACLLGVNPEDCFGHSLMDFVVADDAGPVLESLSRLREGAPAASTTECRLLHKAGRVVWVMITMSLLENAGDGPSDYLIVVHDIQERRRAEAERARMQARLAQGQKMKALGALAGGVAHDFNNLLGVIAGYISMLRSRLPREDPLQQVIATMQASAGRACELTQQLLHFSRKEAPRLGPLDISKSLDNVLKVVTQTFDRRIRVQYLFSTSLPMVMGDAGQLELALLNLCLNARDAMSEGGTLTLEASVVSLSLREIPVDASGPAGDYVRIVVRDTGRGMDGEVIRSIFEPFFTTKQDHKGAGLGLALVHGTVMHHQGFIGVRSQIGRGSEFTVHIPVASPTGVPAPAAFHEVEIRPEF